MSLTTMPSATTPILEPSDLPASIEPSVPPYLDRYRLTVKQYDRMVESDPRQARSR